MTSETGNFGVSVRISRLEILDRAGRSRGNAVTGPL